MTSAHVVPLEGAEADAKTSVGKNGEVIFDGNKYEVVSTCGANTGAPSLNALPSVVSQDHVNHLILKN